LLREESFEPNEAVLDEHIQRPIELVNSFVDEIQLFLSLGTTKIILITNPITGNPEQEGNGHPKSLNARKTYLQSLLSSLPVFSDSTKSAPNEF
jgi:hypothetical protein